MLMDNILDISSQNRYKRYKITKDRHWGYGHPHHRNGEGIREETIIGTIQKSGKGRERGTSALQNILYEIHNQDHELQWDGVMKIRLATDDAIGEEGG